MPVTPRRFNWERPAALWSLIGFAMSLVAHALTYAGIDVSRGMPLVWALHIGAMIAFGAMIIVSRRNSSPNGFVLPDWPAWAYMSVRRRRPRRAPCGCMAAARWR